MIKCKIKIDRIMFPKRALEAGDFSIFTAKILETMSEEKPVINLSYGTVTLKGVVPIISNGDEYIAYFDGKETNKFGTSYTLESLTLEIDKNDKKQVKHFFNMVCGAAISDELMKIDNAYELLIERNSEELLKVKGIGEKRLKQIYTNIALISNNSYAYTKLMPLGLSKKIINKMCVAFGGAKACVDVCFNDPYKLIDKVKGIGFILADEIAHKCGYNNPNERIRRAIKHILETEGENGKSYLMSTQLLHSLSTFGINDFMTINNVVLLMKENKEIELFSNGNIIALKYYLKLEQSLKERFIELRDCESCVKVGEEWKDRLKEIEEEQGWNFTEEQYQAIKAAIENNVVVIAGKAGTGKTSIVSAICKILKDYDIDMCCLSAKACQRMKEVTGMEAKTIHKLLGLGKDQEESSNGIYADVVIMDEASMTNGTLFLKVIEAMCNGSKIIIIGDDGQLTAIGNCAVFNDLLYSKEFSVVRLREIHRQAKKSAIITSSLAIREQKQIYEKGFVGHRVLGELQDLELYIKNKNDSLIDTVVQKFIEYYQEEKNIMELQIITPLKTRGELSVHNINKKIQQIYNSSNMNDSFFKGTDGVEIFKGDKVINLKNNYSCKSTNGETIAVFNGSIGEVISIEDDKAIIHFIGIGRIEINKENFKYINLAYAISVHSSQGSQWRRTICTFDSSAFKLLNVELVYTLLTRASIKSALITNNQALQIAILNVEQKTKQTFLRSFLEK